MRHFDFRLRPANGKLLRDKKVREWFKVIEKVIKEEIRTKKKMVGCLCGVWWLEDKNVDTEKLACLGCGSVGFVVDIE